MEDAYQTILLLLITFLLHIPYLHHLLPLFPGHDPQNRPLLLLLFELHLELLAIRFQPRDPATPPTRSLILSRGCRLALLGGLSDFRTSRFFGLGKIQLGRSICVEAQRVEQLLILGDRLLSFELATKSVRSLECTIAGQLCCSLIVVLVVHVAVSLDTLLVVKKQRESRSIRKVESTVRRVLSHVPSRVFTGSQTTKQRRNTARPLHCHNPNASECREESKQHGARWTYMMRFMVEQLILNPRQFTNRQTGR